MSFHKDTIRVAAAMSGTTVTASTSVVLVPTSSNYTRPFIVTFPNISTFGRLVTVRDNDGFASTGNTIVLSTTSATAFNGVSGPLTINQPYGFITLTSQANGTYSVLNTFAFPAGQAAANVSNLNAQVVNIQSTLNMYDFGTGSTNTIYTSSSQFIFNGNYIGQITSNQLASTVQNLGTTGYLSSIPVVYVVPPTWIAVGQSSTISQASSTGSLVYSSNGANWFNASGGKGFTKYGAATAYGEAYYIAVGNNDTGTPNAGYNQWSFNARDWYYSYGPVLTATQSRTACLYANGLYHSVGCNNGVGGPNTILWSDDGKSWTPSLGSPFVATDGTGYATGIAFGSGNGASGVWVCSGVQNTLAANYSLLWSTDGSNWNPAASVSFGNLAVMDVAFDGTRFVALCTGGAVSGANNVCISTDGSNWTSAGITGGNFNELPRYVTGSNGTWVATTGNSGQSLVYSVDGGFTWQSNANISALNRSMYKPYYDGLNWWIGVETNNGSQSIYYTTQTAPSIQNWANGGQTGGFRNGGFARGFTSTDGQSNVTAILNSTIFGLGVSFSTSNLNASTISAGKAFVGELNASTLYIGVTFVSTTYETINNISTQNVDFISAGTLVSSRNFLDSLSVNRMSVGQVYASQTNMSSLNVQVLSTGSSYTSAANMSSLNVGYVSTGRAYTSLVEVSSLNVGFLSSGQTVGGPARFTSLSTNTISSGTAFIGQLGVNVSSAQYSLDVGGSIWARSTLYVGSNTSTNQIRFYGTTSDGPGQTSSSFTHTVIGEYLYEAPEKSELLIYKGNDTGAGASGPDRVRVLASGGFKVDTGVVGSWPEGGAPPSTITYENALFVSGTNGRVGINTSTPSQTLDVNGSLVSRVTTALGESATLFNDDSSQRYMEHRGPRGAYIDFCAGGTDYNLRVGYFSTSYAEIRTDSSSSASTIALMPKEGTGRVGINTTTPSQTLEVNGSVWARSTLYVGSNSVTNQIRFYGTNDDGQGNFNRTVIGEYLYGGSEQSELILFKGDDATSAAGPDRVRVLAAGGFKVDVGAGVGTWPEGGAPPTAPYQNALFVSGTDGNVSIAQNLTVSGSITTNGGYNLSNSAQSAVMRFLTQGGESFIQSGSNTTSGSENKLYFTNYGWSGTALTTMDFVNDRVGILAQTPTETLDVNGVLNLRAGTVQGYPVVEAANKTNTYAVFADAGTGGTDWAFLRQIGVTNQYHMALDLHDDANDGKFSIRNVASSGTGTDTVRTLFKVDGSNNRVGIMTDDPQYTLDVSGNMRVTGSLSLNTATFSNIAAINTSTCTLEVTKLNSPQLWVAVGMDVTPNNTIKYSSDGFSWNNSSGSGFTTSGDGIGWNGQMWVAVGTDSTPNNTIKYSYNGINWVNSSSGGFTNAGYDVAWNGQMWVAVGWDQTQNNTIKYSYDGINWSNSSGPGFNTGGFNGNFGIGIAWNGKMWLAFGVDLTPNNTIKYSYDGINWSNSSSGGFTYSGYNAAWNGQMWVAVGSSAPNTTIKYSYNGINWFNSINTFSAWGEDVAWNGKMWVAVGNDTTQNNTIKYSSDGINWFNSLGSGFRYIGSGIAWNGQLWVAVGTDTSFNNTIKYSSDGIFWFNSYGSVFGSSALAITYSTQLTPDIKTQNLDIYSQNVPVFQNTKNKIFGLQNGISIPGSLDVNDIRFASYGMTVNLLRYIPLAWMANGGAGDRTAGCPMMYTGAGNKVVFTSNADNSADGYLLGPRAYIKIYDDTSVLRYTFSNLSTENWIFEYAINPVNTNYYYECYLF